MSRIWKIVITAVLVIAAIVGIKLLIAANRPLVEAPKGTEPLDNKLDTSSVVHLIADESAVLSEETKQIISIYNANWSMLGNRVMAVVTVANAENAEDEAWQWVQCLSLDENDALLLIDSHRKRCVLVSLGSFREDIATLEENFLVKLTYMSLREGDFDTAVQAVFEKLHYLYGYDSERHYQEDIREGWIAVAVIALFTLPILLHLIAEKVDNHRFRRWYDSYGKLGTPTVPWRTLFFWHRTGSNWYKVRASGEWVDYRSSLRKERHDAHVRNMMNGGRIR